ncbi:O-antigen ligase family protein [uncultured Algibacter sp.]|uniref:O-antigen ligase family protein n=1 Tax=uncultured Algibacter sp. TaxID=298659 RepID=UPI002631F523|nr:O-antigen ligase family protein [uncultured Algibacter sp.]
MFLFIHGVIAVFIIGYPFTSLISQIIGISICSFYYYNAVRYVGAIKIFMYYSEFSFVVAVLGLLMFYCNITLWDPYRLHSILSEPSRFAIILLPSLYYFIKNKSYLKFSVILFSIILSQSSIGLIGLLLLIIIPNLGLIKKSLKYIPIFIILIFFISKNEHFQIRYNETMSSLSVFSTQKFDRTVNLSSYALISNTYVSYSSFKDHFLGTGLGAFETMHDKYLSDLILPYNISANNSQDINKADANSLFLRILSDLGIFGLIILIYCSYKFFQVIKNKNKDLTIVYGITVYFLLKLLRQGHYFPPEFYFFLFIFIFYIKDLKSSLK